MKCALTACCLLLILSFTASCQSTRHPTLTVGDTIPAFTLTDQDGKAFNSTDHLGRSDLVIFFYPKDESMVCRPTNEISPSRELAHAKTAPPTPT
jgi:peroxiredoxin Q/BCP